MPGSVISHATKIWDINTNWSLYSQCGTWDAKGRGVEVWECILAHCSSPSSAPPNPTYWRYLGRR